MIDIKVVGPVAPPQTNLHALATGIIMAQVGLEFEVTMLDDENGMHQCAFDVASPFGGTFRVTVEPFDG
jgi:hypothetical protein